MAKMDIKKWGLPILLVSVFGIYIIYERFYSIQNNPTPLIENKQSFNQNLPSKQQTIYKDGQYTGDVANTIYGDIQIKATVSSGKITDVQFLQYPSDNGHSQEVSSYSMPRLKKEAIQIQSSQVDVVSGATQTSEGFIQSLASALSKAV